MKHDRNFDELAGRFKKNIYGTDKGQIRLAVLWQHLLDQLPQLTAGRPLRILDAGCGLGVFALRLAELGHQMMLCDISADLLAQAEASFAQHLPDAQVEFRHASLFEVADSEKEPHDLVLCHAVLEWLAEPQLSIPALQRLVKPGGHLSLMFYNVNSLIYRNLVRGNLRKVKSGRYAGEQNSLTPQHPLDPQQVYGWLAESDFSTLDRAGVRVFYDYMERRLRDNLPLEAIIEMELLYSRQEPYLSLGRYIHLFAQHRDKSCSAS